MRFNECKIEAGESEDNFIQRLRQNTDVGLLEAKAIARRESMIRDVYMADTLDELKEVLYRVIGND